MSADQKCIPPWGRRDRDGWHWVTNSELDDGEPRVARWEDGYWNENWMLSNPISAFRSGCRYIAPVPSPADLAALLAENARLRAALERYEDGNAEMADFVAAHDVSGLIVEILGQRYGGPDYPRAAVAQTIIKGIRDIAGAALSRFPAVEGEP